MGKRFFVTQGWRGLFAGGLFAALLGGVSCEQPNSRTPTKLPNGPVVAEENGEMNNPVTAIQDDKGKLRVVKQTSSAPPSYILQGNRGSERLVIAPGLNSSSAVADVYVDGALWGSYLGSGSWQWPEAAVVEAEDFPADEPALAFTSGAMTAVDEEERNIIDFTSSYRIEINTRLPDSSAPPYIYTYIVNPYPAEEPAEGTTSQGTIKARLTGDFTRVFPGSTYGAAAGAGWIAKEVQALDETGAIVGSTLWDGGLLDGRFFTMLLMGDAEAEMGPVKYRVVFQKTGAAPHYSYPPVPLTTFNQAGSHTIYPDEVRCDATAAATQDVWLVNGADYEVPQDGTITGIVLETAAANSAPVFAGVWRNARVGARAAKIYETPVEAAAGNTTLPVEWQVKKGDKIGIMLKGQTAPFVFINPHVNGMALVIDAADNCSAASTFSAVSIGYTFVAQDSARQFHELPLTFAAIPVGGPEKYRGASAETILRTIGGAASPFPANGCYMLMEDVKLGSSEWTPIGGGGRFSGTFFGQGYTVSNVKLKMISTGTGSLAGFFGWTGGGEEEPVIIQDLNLVINTAAPLELAGSSAAYVGLAAARAVNTHFINVHTRSDSPSRPLKIQGDLPRAAYTAGVCAYSNGANLIENTSNSVDFDISLQNEEAAGTLYAGGLAGRADKVDQRITGSYNDADINVVYTGTGGGKIFAGGIAGRIEQPSTVSGCYSTGKISACAPALSGDFWLGGIAGEAHTDNIAIMECYAAGSIVWQGGGAIYAGGIAGYRPVTNTKVARNAALLPAFSGDAAAAELYRIARGANNQGENAAYGGMLRGTAGLFAESGANGANATLAGVSAQAAYSALDWKFASAGSGAGGEEARWVLLSGAAYPFPLLSWQARHLGESADASGRPYSWWEAALPAIKETWAQDAAFAPGEAQSCIIPHTFPEDAPL
ncbi:MAG: hypothetical protein LBC72_04640 [Spirochaetaceae bacterium]|jgi:hypothetical protein|nr:hypothetical protein [Spirochaetaceae bacterium]